jgi:hypothetical protein
MGKIGIILSPDLEKRLRAYVEKNYGSTRGALKAFFTKLVQDFLDREGY